MGNSSNLENRSNTGPGPPASAGRILAGVRVPNPTGAVRLRGDEAAVAAERDTVDPRPTRVEDDRPASPEIPDLYQPVEAPREDPPAVGVERHREHVAVVAAEDRLLAAGRDLPEPDDPVLAHRREALAIGAECRPQDVPLLPVEGLGYLARLRLP
jgi:hypothetical protein